MKQLLPISGGAPVPSLERNPNLKRGAPIPGLEKISQPASPPLAPSAPPASPPSQTQGRGS